MLCSDTANGSAKIACSSSIASGTGEQHRGVGGHELGVAPGGVARHAGVDAGADVAGGEAPAQAEVAGLARGAQRAATPRGTHDSHGFSTTRWPTSKPSASGPSSTTSATTSCPITWGNEQSPLMALSLSPSPKSSRICLESDPQMPVSSGRVTNQSGRSGRASGTSCSATGVAARFWAVGRRRAVGPRRVAVPNTSAFMGHSARTRTAAGPLPRPSTPERLRTDASRAKDRLGPRPGDGGRARTPTDYDTGSRQNQLRVLTD